MADHVEIAVVVDSYEPHDDRPNESIESVHITWNDLQDEQRAAVLYLVCDGLHDLLGRVEQWVPESFVAETGHRMDVKLSFDMTDIDTCVVKRQMEGQKKIEHIVHSLKRMDILDD